MSPSVNALSNLICGERLVLLKAVFCGDVWLSQCLCTAVLKDGLLKMQQCFSCG